MLKGIRTFLEALPKWLGVNYSDAPNCGGSKTITTALARFYLGFQQTLITTSFRKIKRYSCFNLNITHELHECLWGSALSVQNNRLLLFFRVGFGTMLSVLPTEGGYQNHGKKCLNWLSVLIEHVTCGSTEFLVQWGHLRVDTKVIRPTIVICNPKE